MPVWGELVSSGKRELGVHPLQKASNVIGRSSKADVKVQHHQISAQHCLITWNETTRRVVVVDKSSNGTLLRIDGVSKKMAKNTEYEIHDSDAIILVKTTTPEKTDELWFEFHLINPPSGRENIIPTEQPQQAPPPKPPNEILNEEPPSPPRLDEPLISKPNETMKVEEKNVPIRRPDESLNDSLNDSDLPDFDDVLRPYGAYVPPPAPVEKKTEPAPPVTLKILQYPVKRTASEKHFPSSGPSAAKKSAPSVSNSKPITYPTASSSGGSAPIIFTRVTAPVSSSSTGVNLDDSDELPDLIPDFKAPASVAELRAKPPSSVAPITSTSSKTSTSAPTATLSAADRARKLMASGLPPDFLSENTASKPGAENEQPEPSAEPPAAAPKPSTSSSAGNMEENLICTICQEIFHDPINVVPCNHVFCAGCLSMWLDKSKDCPQCRTHVDNCAEHHLLKNLVECFLSSHPDRKRTPEELAELDTHNKITKNKNKKPSPGRGRGGLAANRGGHGGGGGGGGAFFGGYSDSGSDDFSDSDDFDNSAYFDSDDGDSDTGYPFGGLAGSILNAITLGLTAGRGRGSARGGARGGRGRGRGGLATGAGASGVAPWGLICRQCPGGSLAAVAPPPAGRGGGRGGRRGSRNSTRIAVGATSSTGPSAGTSTASTSNATGNGNIPPPTSIPPYTCIANSHNVCRCCSERFPAREGQPGIPPLRCSLCQGTHCHLYWGCRAPGCTGCLGALNAFTTTVHELEGGIAMQTNTVEAGFFAEYMHSHSISTQSVLDVGYQMMEFNAMPELHGLTSQSVVCRICFKNKVIPAIAYAYRAQLTNSDLPAAVFNRPNCPWGKECRTQKKSVPHSRKHNHICQPSANAAGTSQ